MTKIEWVRGDDGSEGLSWNALRAVRDIMRKSEPVTVSANHCEHVNEACRFCYSERGNPRLGGLPFKRQNRDAYRFTVNEEKLREPIRRRKPTKIFVESTSDAFGEWWPREFVDKLYAAMALCPHHLFINLSKRPERRRDYLADPDTYHRVAVAMVDILADTSIPQLHAPVTDKNHAWPLPNVVEGTSVSCQDEANEFVPILLQTRTAIRAVSCEPLLGPVDLTKVRHRLAGESYMISSVLEGDDGFGLNAPRKRLDWVIVGGESGSKARPMHPDWARSLRDQCAAAGVAFFFKQRGEWSWREPDDGTNWVPQRWLHISGILSGRGAVTPRDEIDVACVGKKAAGRLLDGREHNDGPAMPNLPAPQTDAAA